MHGHVRVCVNKKLRSALDALISKFQVLLRTVLKSVCLPFFVPIFPSFSFYRHLPFIRSSCSGLLWSFLLVSLPFVNFVSKYLPVLYIFLYHSRSFFIFTIHLMLSILYKEPQIYSFCFRFTFVVTFHLFWCTSVFINLLFSFCIRI